MAVSRDNPAPYATTASVVDIINKYRDRGMQTPFTKDVLGRAGVSDSLIPRTLQSLEILDLIREDGMPTETFEAMRLSPTNELQQRMQDWLKAAYADVFLYVDPSVDDEVAIRDAFRTYIPTGQQDRMVSLFIGLCEEAGLREKPEKPAKPRAKPNARRQTPKSRPKPNKSSTATFAGQSSIPPALIGLLDSLPKESGHWTQEARDKFYVTFGTVLDFCYEIKEEETNNNGEDEETDDN